MFWTLLPVYNMVLIALSEDGDEFTGSVWPSHPSFEGFQMIWTGEYWYLDNFWHQFGNSAYIGLGTMVLTVLIGSLASFAMGRMRLRKAWRIGNLSLITYAVPASFLVIPFTPAHDHLRAAGQSVGGHRGAGHVRNAVCHPDLPSVWQAHPARTRRRGAGGWRNAVSGVSCASICR